MKEHLFSLKRALSELFSYPVSRLSLGAVDYDAYWKDKRGSALGALSPWQKERADLFLASIDTSTPISIVDIGCGDGSVLHYIKEHATVAKAYGVDVSPLALAKAREWGIETVEMNVSAAVDMTKIPSADYVLMFEVLEHMGNSEEFLGAMRERATQGVFFSFPNTGYLMHRLRLLLGRFPLQWRLTPGEHLRFWTYKDLRWWMKALGYTHYTLRTYRGTPLLSRIWPSVFAAGLFVFLPKH